MVAGLRDGRMGLREAHRFPNEPLGSGRQLHWDVDELLTQTCTGLLKAAALLPADADPSPGVTAWGVDVGLLGADGCLLAPVEHYRAADPDGGRALHEQFGADRLFRRTGVLPQPINTAFRLGRLVAAATAETGPAALQGATALLVPDLWCALLTGDRAAERSIASTTGLLSASTGDWDTALAEAAGVGRGLLPEVVENATCAGVLRRTSPTGPNSSGRGTSSGSPRTTPRRPVAAIGGHPRTAFLSSGTWSLIGVETAGLLTSVAALGAWFTNEAGLAGATLTLRTLTGLWLLEQAARTWRPQRLDVELPALLGQAAADGPVVAAVDVGDPALVSAGDVLGTLAALCADAGLAPPSTPGEVTRCILQILALSYRRTVKWCETLTGEPVEALDMTGGGSRNGLLRQLTADACGRPVRFGPAEGTALGSVATQAFARGHLADLSQLQAVLRASTEVGVQPPSGEIATRHFLGPPRPRRAGTWSEATVSPAAGPVPDPICRPS